MIDLAPYIEEVARKLLGEPNRALSKRHELRFGNKGSISVKIHGHKHAGTWHDFENEIGGGVWDLLDIACITGFDAVRAWFQAELRVDIDDYKFDRSQPEPQPQAPREIAYDYVNEAGELVFRVHRGRDKRFWQTQPGPDRGGIKRDPQTDKPTMQGVKLVPYHLDELALAARANANGHGWRVFIVEGEKDADRLREDWLVPATTNPGGAGKWRKDYAQYFAGADAVLIADNDQAGRDHMADVAKKIAKVATRVRVLDLSVPDKGDISDWMDAGGTQSDLEDLIDGVEDFKPLAANGWANGHTSWTGDTIDGGLWARTAPPPRDWFIEDWIPRGQCSLFYGIGGVRKTQFALQAMVAGALGGYLCGIKLDQCKTLGLFVEDSHNEIGRRLQNIIAYYRLHYPNSIDAAMEFNFHYKSLVGIAETEFVEFKYGEAEATPAFEVFRKVMGQIRPSLVVLDTAVDFYGSDDIKRRDVGRFFRFMDGVAAEFNCAIMMLGHPSLASHVDETNLRSGATTWEHKARAVIGLRKGKPEEDEDGPVPDWRILRRQKSNYAEQGEEMRLVFGEREDAQGNKTGHPGIFWRPPVKVASVLQKIDCRRKFVELLRTAPSQVYFNDQKQSNNYAPRRFAQVYRDFTERDFERAMDDLLLKEPRQITIAEGKISGRWIRRLVEIERKESSHDQAEA